MLEQFIKNDVAYQKRKHLSLKRYLLFPIRVLKLNQREVLSVP